MRFAIYLKFNGNCEDALNTYKELFSGEVICQHRFNQHMTKDKNLLGKIFHAELKINHFYIYMCDTADELNYDKQPYKITIECDSLTELHNYFDTLKHRGNVLNSVTQMPWGDYIGHLKDEFGIAWDFVCSTNK
ncbi:MAG: VOC family protein [Bacilli bacterium]|nr:VOC family protein [Bacilli bacterium]